MSGAERAMSGDWRLGRTYHGAASGEVRWERLGNGAGEPVVLLHGTPFSSYVWRDIAGALAQRYEVYVWDMPGYGASAKAAGQDVSLAAQAGSSGNCSTTGAWPSRGRRAARAPSAPGSASSPARATSFRRTPRPNSPGRSWTSCRSRPDCYFRYFRASHSPGVAGAAVGGSRSVIQTTSVGLVVSSVAEVGLLPCLMAWAVSMPWAKSRMASRSWRPVAFMSWSLRRAGVRVMYEHAPDGARPPLAGSPFFVKIAP
jgi:alpha/beta hydrolase family protein